MDSRSSKSTRRKKQWFLGSQEGSSIKDPCFVLCGSSDLQIAFLNQIGIYPSAVAVDETELNIRGSLPPHELVEQMSAAKAKEVAKILSESNVQFDIIIACESVVALGNEVIGKPQNADDAINILSRLNNRSHSVLCGVTLIYKSQRCETFTVETTVRFAKISAEMIRGYINCGECFAHNGAYDFRGKAACFIKSIVGDPSNAAGFPLQHLMQKFREYLLSPDDSVTGRRPSRATPSAPTTGPRPIPTPRTIFPAPVNRDTVPAESKEEDKENSGYDLFVDKSYSEFEANLSAVDNEDEVHLNIACLPQIERSYDPAIFKTSDAIERKDPDYSVGIPSSDESSRRLVTAGTRRRFYKNDDRFNDTLDSRVADCELQNQQPSMPVPSSVIGENRLNNATYNPRKATDIASEKIASHSQRYETLRRTQLPREHYSRHVSSSRFSNALLFQPTHFTLHQSESQHTVPQQQHPIQDDPPPAFPKFITPGPFRPVSILTANIQQMYPPSDIASSDPATGNSGTSELHQNGIDP